jgi:Family of unknown function (DUF6308)
MESMTGHRPLVIQDAESRAEHFFRTDLSSVHRDSYDRHVLSRRFSHKITERDIVAINATMAARASHGDWAEFWANDDDIPSLVAVALTWDLLEMTDTEWLTCGVSERLADVLAAIWGYQRKLSRVTKVLHIKRPALIPVCDSYVVQAVGGRSVTVADGVRVIEHLRKQGRANLPTLKAIQTSLAQTGFDRSLVRILDAIIWSNDPRTVRPACVA